MPDRRCAVVIGVERVRSRELATLQYAVAGAQRFADWARAQNIDVTLLVDREGEVTLAAVKQAVKAYVEQRTYTQLVLFFSGHGLLPAPESEVWLLSGAPDDPDEAISVSGSVRLARNVGIPHVVVISDACRSRPDTARMGEVTGRNIFPNEPPRPRRPEVDLFYATLPGDPAYEVASAEAIAGYRSIFTDCALKGLGGAVPEVIEQIAGPTALRHVVTPRRLKAYLESEVPEATAAVRVALQQFPDIRVESGAHSVLAELTRGPPRSGDPVRPLSVEPSLRDVVRRGVTLEARPAKEARMLQRFDFAGAIVSLLAASRRAPKDVDGTGFVVIGAAVANAAVDGLPCHVGRKGGTAKIKVYTEASKSGPAQSTLIEFADGTGTVLAVLPDYVGTVIVEGGRIATVNYTPSGSSRRYWEYRDRIDDVQERRAYATVASRHGVFELPASDAEEFAGFLRVLKGIDPTLGLYAAYAYAQAGRIEQVRSVYQYMQQEAAPVLFDVAKLAQPLPPGAKPPRHGVAPFCPMLSQGWALLGDQVDALPAPVREARRHLVPGLWTTFTAKGVELLRPLMEV